MRKIAQVDLVLSFGRIFEMPTISRFFGMDVRMYFEDHAPPLDSTPYLRPLATVLNPSFGAQNGVITRERG